MKGDSSLWTKQRNNEAVCYAIHNTIGQTQNADSKPTPTTAAVAAAQKLASSLLFTTTSTSTFSFVPMLVVSFLLLFASLSTPVFSSPTVSDSGHHLLANQTLRPGKELHKLKSIRALLRKINKPAVKTIQSSDGDVIDCVPSHLQPAFDHPELRGQKPLDPPERPKGHENTETVAESFQLWTDSGESCPEGTIPIRRTTEKDILRASSIRRFGRKPRRVRRDSTGNGHEVGLELSVKKLAIETGKN